MVAFWPVAVALIVAAIVGVGIGCYRWGWKDARLASSRPAQRIAQRAR